MPLYEYRCPSCDDGLTVAKPMSAATEPEPCPLCRKPMERVYEPVAARVKGGTKLFHGVRG